MSPENPQKNTPPAPAGATGRDGFPLDPSAPDYRWHRLISDFLQEPLIFSQRQRIQFANKEVVKVFCAASADEQAEALIALVKRRLTNEQRFEAARVRSADESDSARVLGKLTVYLLQRNPRLTSAQAASLISLYPSASDRRFAWDDARALLKICQKLKDKGALPPDVHAALAGLTAFLDPANDPDDDWEGAPERRTRIALEMLL